jgi:hypothetical protein
MISMIHQHRSLYAIELQKCRFYVTKYLSNAEYRVLVFLTSNLNEVCPIINMALVVLVKCFQRLSLNANMEL